MRADMRLGPADRLLEAARALPGTRDPVRLAVPALTTALPESPALAARVGAFLRALADRLEPALTDGLLRATRAWDQADSLSVLKGDLIDEANELRAAATQAKALTALLSVDVAVALVRLLETRLATFIRLRTQSGGDLVVDGRPFLDIAAAIGELARRWA